MVEPRIYVYIPSTPGMILTLTPAERALTRRVSPLRQELYLDYKHYRPGMNLTFMAAELLGVFAYSSLRRTSYGQTSRATEKLGRPRNRLSPLRYQFFVPSDYQRFVLV